VPGSRARTDHRQHTATAVLTDPGTWVSGGARLGEKEPRCLCFFRLNELVVRPYARLLISHWPSALPQPAVSINLAESRTCGKIR
jgi:hypothetical protein